MQKSKPLVFFGSGPVAAASLDALAQHFVIDAIVTKPKTVQQMSVPSLDARTPIHAVNNAAELDSLIESKALDNNLGIIVDFGVIVSRKVIDYFEHGIINSHFSLLPQWRGADPISFAILSGQTKTGVSLMLINDKLDEGLLLDQQDQTIESNDTAPSLTDKLVGLSNKMLAKDIPMYLSGTLKPYPQTTQDVSYSRKLTKEDGLIDLSKPAETIEREIRAYSGWPKSYSTIYGQKIIVLEADSVEKQDDESLFLECTPGYIKITKLIAPSGRTMTGADFIRGYKKA